MLDAEMAKLVLIEEMHIFIMIAFLTAEILYHFTG